MWCHLRALPSQVSNLMPSVEECQGSAPRRSRDLQEVRCSLARVLQPKISVAIQERRPRKCTVAKFKVSLPQIKRGKGLVSRTNQVTLLGLKEVTTTEELLAKCQACHRLVASRRRTSLEQQWAAVLDKATRELHQIR